MARRTRAQRRADREYQDWFNVGRDSGICWVLGPDGGSREQIARLMDYYVPVLSGWGRSWHSDRGWNPGITSEQVAVIAADLDEDGPRDDEGYLCGANVFWDEHSGRGEGLPGYVQGFLAGALETAEDLAEKYGIEFPSWGGPDGDVPVPS
jgi:hypothetical protein